MMQCRMIFGAVMMRCAIADKSTNRRAGIRSSFDFATSFRAKVE